MNEAGTDRAGRGRARFGTVLLCLSSVLLSLALAEAALRILEPRSLSAVPAPDPEGRPVLRTLPELLEPNVTGLYKGKPYRTNRYRFRGPDLELAKPAGVFRVAVIGDSITMGEGVAEADAYPALLEASLEPPEGARFEVLNLGLSGLNLRQSLHLRLPTALRFDPDLIVYGFTINDLEGLPGYRNTRHPPPPPPRESWRLSWLLRRGLGGIRDSLGLPGSYRAEVIENFFDNPPVWRAFEADLAKLAANGRRHGVCVAVLLHTQLWTERRWVEPILKRVERAARANELHVIPTEPAFEGLDVETLQVGPFDSHPNALGHRRLADALTDGLAALPERCWKGVRPAFEPRPETSGDLAR